jgi:hypothetical protein
MSKIHFFHFAVISFHLSSHISTTTSSSMLTCRCPVNLSLRFVVMNRNFQSPQFSYEVWACSRGYHMDVGKRTNENWMFDVTLLFRSKSGLKSFGGVSLLTLKSKTPVPVILNLASSRRAVRAWRCLMGADETWKKQSLHHFFSMNRVIRCFCICTLQSKGSLFGLVLDN